VRAKSNNLSLLLIVCLIAFAPSQFCFAYADDHDTPTAPSEANNETQTTGDSSPKKSTAELNYEQIKEGVKKIKEFDKILEAGSDEDKKNEALFLRQNELNALRDLIPTLKEGRDKLLSKYGTEFEAVETEAKSLTEEKQGIEELKKRARSLESLLSDARKSPRKIEEAQKEIRDLRNAILGDMENRHDVGANLAAIYQKTLDRMSEFERTLPPQNEITLNKLDSLGIVPPQKPSPPQTEPQSTTPPTPDTTKQDSTPTTQKPSVIAEKDKPNRSSRTPASTQTPSINSNSNVSAKDIRDRISANTDTHGPNNNFTGTTPSTNPNSSAIGEDPNLKNKKRKGTSADQGEQQPEIADTIPKLNKDKNNAFQNVVDNTAMGSNWNGSTFTPSLFSNAFDNQQGSSSKLRGAIANAETSKGDLSNTENSSGPNAEPNVDNNQYSENSLISTSGYSLRKVSGTNFLKGGRPSKIGKRKNELFSNNYSSYFPNFTAPTQASKPVTAEMIDSTNIKTVDLKNRADPNDIAKFNLIENSDLDTKNVEEKPTDLKSDLLSELKAMPYLDSVAQALRDMDLEKAPGPIGDVMRFLLSEGNTKLKPKLASATKVRAPAKVDSSMWTKFLTWLGIN